MPGSKIVSDRRLSAVVHLAAKRQISQVKNNFLPFNSTFMSAVKTDIKTFKQHFLEKSVAWRHRAG